jgi:hypothetical protein
MAPPGISDDKMVLGGASSASSVDTPAR